MGWTPKVCKVMAGGLFVGFRAPSHILFMSAREPFITELKDVACDPNGEYNARILKLKDLLILISKPKTPKPSTSNPLNPQPLNSKPLTLNPQPLTLPLNPDPKP